jgi:putative ABC transport system substrate-binding protein
MMKRRELLVLVGAAMAVARSLGAQQKRLPVVGLLKGGAPDPNSWFESAFRQGLREAGYVDGQNVAIQTEYYSMEGYDQLPVLVADLVGRNVDVIAISGMPSALAAKGATSRIPIVFSVGTDPVAEGLVASLARPGGNLTGVAIMATELMPKRLELLSELVPRATMFALLVNPNNASTEPQTRDVQKASDAKGLRLRLLKASTEGGIDAAFATLGQLRAEALLVGTDPFFFNRRRQLVALAGPRSGLLSQ